MVSESEIDADRLLRRYRREVLRRERDQLRSEREVTAPRTRQQQCWRAGMAEADRQYAPASRAA